MTWSWSQAFFFIALAAMLTAAFGLTSHQREARLEAQLAEAEARAAVEARILELEPVLECNERLLESSWPPIDVEHHLCVRWARDDPEAMPVRVVSDHPMMREQRATQATDDAAPTGDAVLVDRNWIGRSGTCRVVEVNHPRAVPIREAREGEPAFRVAFVRPEPGERAEWGDPRKGR